MITSEKIKNLRLKTGAGMMDCKKALEEVNGDIDGAVDWLRKKGISKAQKKSARDASEGLITISIIDHSAAVVEINCETDFVARNQDFQKFCNKLQMPGFGVHGHILWNGLHDNYCPTYQTTQLLF